ncbi:MAG: cobalamin-binding protein [Gammaproteobacteria bacterium]|nr:cobalamin-binding protein [Gammaproteobacteria bacterium]
MLSIIPALSHAFLSDDVGNVINLTKPAERIISLAPDITEILFAIGAGSKIVGVIQGCDYPAGAKKIPIIGAFHGLDLERIIALEPDLIITWGHTFAHQLAPFKKMGIPIYVSAPHKLKDIPRRMRAFGELTHLGEEASAQAKLFEQTLAAIKKRYSAKSKVRVFYQIGTYTWMTVNKDNWINEVIELCGGENIFKEAQGVAPNVSIESILAEDPEVVITDTQKSDWQKAWQPWSALSAVAANAFFAINADLIDRAGPRLLKGAQQMCNALESSRHQKEAVKQSR